MSGKITDKKSVRDFLVILEAKGVRDVIITPGSRNAPFSISFFKHPSFQTLSITDERSAAFFALGMAQQTGRPVVLICTSGTAALNFSPAIAEAFYQRIPLLVVTADRPLEWVDQGEGQTIRQSKVFSNFVKGSFDIVQEAAHKDLIWHNQRIINEAVDLATKTTLGPVHINFPLRESLYKTI
ncbi:MAG: 2-succinyl-5-enolpyruvyl-6-hydroxy-3-cyclohexene-1-carboxylic-acid synthase, partial [Crocinitomicaceae bacterium]|nr:2-succinyl-5-enolpyruvyl-6-hydroxy-3-cyclohexene-1-carboxylic-acid synthase [Crocinitomicaceae bacterium]